MPDAADGTVLPTPSDEDRRKHLDYIQAVITRMSAASSTAKGWLLPVVTATYGYALTKPFAPVALLGIAAAALFALLDANYLRQEKAYRHLYDTVARSTRPVPLFSLDPSEADDPPPPCATRSDRLRARLARWFPSREVWSSWAVAPFYGGLTVVGVVVWLVSR